MVGERSCQIAVSGRSFLLREFPWCLVGGPTSNVRFRERATSGLGPERAVRAGAPLAACLPFAQPGEFKDW